jgi:1-acyl-sn-glycerol-3-phosphate acyltransferase
MSEQQNTQPRLGWSLQERDANFIKLLMPIWELLYRYYFRVQTSGWENIPSQDQVLLVGSHNGGIAAPDMHMMMYDWFRRFGVERPVYGLMHPKAWQVSPEIGQLAAKVGAIIARPRMATAALRSGASLLVYPGGPQDLFRLHSQRHDIFFAGRKGFIKLALQQNVPIVPVISTGAHDTLIILSDIYPFVNKIHEMGIPWLFNVDPEVFPVYLGLPWGLGIGPLPNIPFVFEKYGAEAASDKDYVNKCYETVVSKMQYELDILVKASQSN